MQSTSDSKLEQETDKKHSVVIKKKVVAKHKSVKLSHQTIKPLTKVSVSSQIPVPLLQTAISIDTAPITPTSLSNRGRFFMKILTDDEIRSLNDKDLTSRLLSATNSLKTMETKYESKRTIDYDLERSIPIRKDYINRLKNEKARRKIVKLGLNNIQIGEDGQPINKVSNSAVQKIVEGEMCALLEDSKQEMKVHIESMLTEQANYIINLEKRIEQLEKLVSKETSEH